MRRALTANPRPWIACALLVLIVASVLAWYVNRETLPARIRIATASEGGQYHDFARRLALEFQDASSRVELLPSGGSLANHDMLTRGDVHFAIVQGGAVPLQGLSIIAPLYPEAVHVVARKSLGARSIMDLRGQDVVIGPEGSGMRVTANAILTHYGLASEVRPREDAYFLDLLENPSLDAAIVTTGLRNRDLNALLKSGLFDLIPIDSADAIAMKDPFLKIHAVPRGLFAEGPPLPPSQIQTLASPALLVARDDVVDELVRETLKAIYEGELPLHFPNLFPRAQAVELSVAPLHPIARRYFHPTDQLGAIANIFESLAAIKELLFALGAAVFLLWERWRRAQEAERLALLQEKKDHLDEYLARTLAIEEAQIDTVDPDQLKIYLNQVTRIKLEALKQLTDEELRSDQAFAIFIAQCANLINKIQFKISSRQPRDE